ncbi:hypothetical protein DACRYDRAFT_107599 [Dacryopinax primogenitus]|uniref:DNA-directed RNA polymerase III subunit RPC5 n=1 Tax=Dacryopinax primogenitus (strain DJM 731) TaxID=1858805 RepID=M5FZC2_DACPD|nr:uncharacterized protein DACRYDRAFT_107599 [Dacryopinax primogenitus]EJU01864.1 hypothetical protein DACRYDRAFT_107599 [Dacryopinax primogenitus]
MSSDILMADAGPSQPQDVHMIDPDAPIATIPIHLSNRLAPNLSIHQFPLLTQLRVPASAEAAGRKIKARHKPKSGIVEVRLPLDTREEVYNEERGNELGLGREEEEAESSASGIRRKKKSRSDEEIHKRLDEVRLVSQSVKGAKPRTTNMVGVLRDNTLYLHPLEHTYQLRPSLDYLDVLAARDKESRKKDYDDDDEEEGKDGGGRGKPRDVREVIGTVKAPGSDKDGLGGTSGVRKEMLMLMRDEKEEKWHDLEWNDSNTERANEIYETLFPNTQHVLKSASKLGDVLTSIHGLSEPSAAS